MRTCAFNLHDDLIDRLDAVAAATDRSRSFVCRVLLERALATEPASRAGVGFHSTDDRQRTRAAGG